MKIKLNGKATKIQRIKILMYHHSLVKFMGNLAMLPDEVGNQLNYIK